MSLLGKRLLVTRPRLQAAGFCAKLAAAGAQPILFPTIEIAPLDDYAALDKAIHALSQYHWIIFTSVNGVAAFWSRLDLSGLRPTLPHSGGASQDPKGLTGKIAAIGPATARALEARGVHCEFIPDEYVAEAIVAKIGNVKGQRILLPRADIARETLAIELANRGAVVHEIAAYRTLPVVPDPDGLAELRRGVDAITFTSSSTVRNFIALVEQDSILPYPVVACIGPITAQTAREVGLPVQVMAREYTTDGLVAALDHYFSELEN